MRIVFGAPISVFAVLLVLTFVAECRDAVAATPLVDVESQSMYGDARYDTSLPRPPPAPIADEPYRPNPDPSHVAVSDGGCAIHVKPHGIDAALAYPSDDARHPRYADDYTRDFVMESGGDPALEELLPSAADTINLDWAFNHLRRDSPQCTVHLHPGRYHLSRTIVARAMTGRIVGVSGRKDDTILVARGPLKRVNANGYTKLQQNARDAGTGTSSDSAKYELVPVFPALPRAARLRYYLPGIPPLLLFTNERSANNHESVDAWDWAVGTNTSTHIELAHFTLLVDDECRGPPVTNLAADLQVMSAGILVSSSSSNYRYGIDRHIEHITLNAHHLSILGMGQSRLPYGTNLMMGIVVWGAEVWKWVGRDAMINLGGWMEEDHLPVNAVVRIEHCTFMNLLNHGTALEGFYSPPSPGSYITVESLAKGGGAGNAGYVMQRDYPPSVVAVRDNEYFDVGRGCTHWLAGNVAFGLFLISPSGVDVRIERNRFLRMHNKAISLMSSQVLTLTPFPVETSHVLIRDNTVHVVTNTALSSSSAAVYLADFNAEPFPSANATGSDAAHLAISIVNNTLIADFNVTHPLVLHAAGRNVLISGNRFVTAVPAALTARSSSKREFVVVPQSLQSALPPVICIGLRLDVADIRDTLLLGWRQYFGHSQPTTRRYFRAARYGSIRAVTPPVEPALLPEVDYEHAIRGSIYVAGIARNDRIALDNTFEWRIVDEDGVVLEVAPRESAVVETGHFAFNTSIESDAAAAGARTSIRVVDYGWQTSTAAGPASSNLTLEPVHWVIQLVALFIVVMTSTLWWCQHHRRSRRS